MEEPLVSIIMPVYNMEKYIGKAIESVLNQTYSNWELLIIDDSSTDLTKEKVLKYHDSRIRYMENNTNFGVAQTRNRGLDSAKGKFITFLDGDDFWESIKLKNQVDFMLRKKLQMSHGNYHFCDTLGKKIKQVETDEKIEYSTLLKGNQFKIMTVMIQKEVIGNIRFQEIKHEDYAFFLDILRKGIVSYSQINEFNSFCTIGRGDSVSGQKLKSAVWTWKIYRKYEKLSLLKSIYYFVNYAIQGVKKYR